MQTSLVAFQSSKRRTSCGDGQQSSTYGRILLELKASSSPIPAICVPINAYIRHPRPALFALVALQGIGKLGHHVPADPAGVLSEVLKGVEGGGRRESGDSRRQRWEQGMGVQQGMGVKQGMGLKQGVGVKQGVVVKQGMRFK